MASMGRDDAWRPRCGACGATSVMPGFEPRCSACGAAWDGSEASEPAREGDVPATPAVTPDQLADVIDRLLRAGIRDVQVHCRLGDDETDEQFAARIRASMADPRKEH